MIAIDGTVAPRNAAWPWLALAGVGALGGYAYLRHQDRVADVDLGVVVAPAVALAGPPPPPPGRWVWPVPRWRGRAPVVSDGYGSPRVGGNRGAIHRGADVMFRRRWRSELTDVYPAHAPHSRGHFMPPGTLALAASDGEIWSAGWTPRGYSVVLSHGAPWATYYTHLSALRVGETRRGRTRQRVVAGQPLGVIGADPKDANAIAHLHFEIWYGGNGLAAIDPHPYLRGWPVVDAPEVA